MRPTDAESSIASAARQMTQLTEDLLPWLAVKARARKSQARNLEMLQLSSAERTPSSGKTNQPESCLDWRSIPPG